MFRTPIQAAFAACGMLIAPLAAGAADDPAQNPPTTANTSTGDAHNEDAQKSDPKALFAAQCGWCHGDYGMQAAQGPSAGGNQNDRTSGRGENPQRKARLYALIPQSPGRRANCPDGEVHKIAPTPGLTWCRRADPRRHQTRHLPYEARASQTRRRRRNPEARRSTGNTICVKLNALPIPSIALRLTSSASVSVRLGLDRLASTSRMIATSRSAPPNIPAVTRKDCSNPTLSPYQAAR